MDDTNRPQENEIPAEHGAADAALSPKKRKFTDNIVVLFLLTAALLMLGQLLGLAVEALFFLKPTEFVYTAVLYFEFIGIWLVTLLYMRVTKKNRPLFKMLGPAMPGNNVKLLLLGIAIGFGLNGVCILTAWLHKDFSLRFACFQPLPLLVLFVAVFVQSSAEELICRGFLYQRLRWSYQNPAVAIIGNSLLFALLHLLNEGVTVLSIVNIFVVGVLFSFMVYYLDSLWCAMAAHAAWNFTQNIVFGLPNSGLIVPYSVFQLDTASVKNSFAYATGFGIEGTVLANAVLILACGGLYLFGRRKRPAEVSDSIS